VALPEDSSERLRCYRNALENWNYDGYLDFRALARNWIKANVSRRTLNEIKRLLHEFVAAGGKIDEQPETRSEFFGFEYHYDIRMTIDGIAIYFETVLECKKPDDPDDPRITVVNVHEV